MKLLFITSNRIGDAVLSTGLLSHLIDRDPGIRVTIAAGPAAAPLFEGVPNLDRVISFEKRPYSLHWLTLWRETVGTRWDVAVDLRRSAVLNLLRVGERIVVPKGKGSEHRLSLLGRPIGRRDTPPLPRLWCLDAHTQAADQLLQKTEGPLLAIGPTANWQGKVWPAERFIEVLALLTAPGGPMAGARVAVLGGPGAQEREQAQPVLDAITPDRCIDLVGKASLLTIGALLKRATLFIGNDSGLMHISAAVGCRTLGLFGPSKDTLYAPSGPRASFVRTPEDMDTLIGFDGYNRHTVGSLMTSLSVDAVFSEAKTLLARP